MHRYSYAKFGTFFVPPGIFMCMPLLQSAECSYSKQYSCMVGR